MGPAEYEMGVEVEEEVEVDGLNLFLGEEAELTVFVVI